MAITTVPTDGTKLSVQPAHPVLTALAWIVMLAIALPTPIAGFLTGSPAPDRNAWVASGVLLVLVLVTWLVFTLRPFFIKRKPLLAFFVRSFVIAWAVTLCLVHRPALLFAQSAHPIFGTTEEEVTFHSEEVTLSGTLILPATAGPHPAVVLVHGSSPNVRDPLLGFAAEVFAQHGVAALAYDKRGYGRSSGNPNKNSLSSLADDALAGVHYLQSRADIDPKRVGMEGESQGGWIIPIAASRGKEVAFMVLVAASGVSPAQQGVFNIEHHLRNAGWSERILDTGRKARKLEADYAYAVNQGRLPATDELKDLYGFGLDHDPVPALEQITQPVLIFLGEADPFVPTEYSALVFDKAFKKAGNQDYTIIIYPGADHSIEVPIKSAQGLTVLKYVEGYHETMTNWVVAHVNGAATPSQRIQGSTSDQSAAFSETGIYGKPSWYGMATVQLSLIGLFAPVFLSAALGFTVATMLSKVRHERTLLAPLGARRARVLAIVTSALSLIVLVGVIAFIAELLSSGEEVHIDSVFNVLPVLSLLAVLLTVGMCGFAVLAWKHKYWSLAGRVYYSLLTVVAVLFVLFLNYWNLLGLQL
jgi:pimeloyl-ACP methyl ester carboxylesterase